jgi:Na+-transporting NADH:ubiquinone oxidoreductase subunit A
MVERVEVSKGLDLPISGEPTQTIEIASAIDRVGILGRDYVGMRPGMIASEGDIVKRGQPLFVDKKTEGVQFTSPVNGKVIGVHRGDKRLFLSCEIEVTGDEALKFDVPGLQGSREKVVQSLVESGLWTALRSRPFGRVPAIDGEPHAIFVTAIDTNPLAADPKIVIAANTEFFEVGLRIVSKLTNGLVHVCRGPNATEIPGENLDNVRVTEFDGPHPAGLVGTHMHFVSPASAKRVNWHIGYQDVIAIGKLFETRELCNERVVALGGPKVTNPRLLQTILGADLTQLTSDETEGADLRVISGSPLCGYRSSEPVNFLGRYHNQVSVLAEGHEREFLGWQMPGFDKFSVTRAFAGAWVKAKKFSFTTSTGGSERAMVPIGTYEKVMPLDVLPTLLLRSLISRDTERAIELGCLELDEEDVALCTYVCPGKYEYGEILRDNLHTIEKEG